VSSGPNIVASGSTFAVTRPDALQSTAAVFVNCVQRLVPTLGSLDSFDRLMRVARGDSLGGTADQHDAVCAFLDCLKAAGSLRAVAPEAYGFVSKCVEYDRYLDQKVLQFNANARDDWARTLESDNNPILAQVVDEIASHIRAFAGQDQQYESIVQYSRAKIEALLPAEIANMRQEANIALILPSFERSLTVPGDMAEFGCFRGVLSVKLAWLAKAMGVRKHYYTFDTFHGFEIADPAGGALGVGAFRDDAFNAYNFLSQWGRILDLTPVKGDATKTCSQLVNPLSFVWLDLDMGVLMDPVLAKIWPLCSAETIIGIDDVGRPETPTVAPWLNELLAAGALEVAFDSDQIAPNTFIRFVKKAGEFPATPMGQRGGGPQRNVSSFERYDT
jgi:hypothetical protein